MNGHCKSQRAGVIFGGAVRGQRGVSLVELSVVAGILVTILIVVTDYSLSILARQEVHSAARAGAEYASERGYNPVGIVEAATCSKGTESQSTTVLVPSTKGGKTTYTPVTTTSIICSPSKLQSITGVQVNGSLASSNPAPYCVCNGNFYGDRQLALGTAGAYTCKGLPTCDSGMISVQRSAYVEVTVTGSYAPLFPFLGWSNRSSVPITAKSVVKTFFP